MQYRVIPKTKEKLSVLGYGCMRFPTRAGLIDEKKSSEQLMLAVEKGVNYFDTAYPYHAGASEPFLGKVFTGALREKVNIATKLPSYIIKSREQMESILDKQLKKLKTDYIDYYLLHMLMGFEQWSYLKQLGVIEFLEKAKAEGKIRHIGFSYHGQREDFPLIIDDYDWCLSQIQFNYLDVNTQAGLTGLRYAASKDVAVIVMEPLRGGSIAGKIPEKVQREWEASQHSWSPAEWSLRWIMNFSEVTCVLSGMNDDAHIIENVNTACEARAGSLTDDDLKRVERVCELYRKSTKVPCTGCGYCLPCPVGVDIPAAFRYYNGKYLFGGLHNRWMYLNTLGGFSGGERALASLCVECGKCERVCPQHIAIRKELKQVKKEFEGWVYPAVALASRAFVRRNDKK